MLEETPPFIKFSSQVAQYISQQEREHLDGGYSYAETIAMGGSLSVAVKASNSIAIAGVITGISLVKISTARR